MAVKSENEALDVFIPERGLDVRDYLDQPLAPDATSKDQRLRKQAIHHLGRYTWATRVLKGSAPGRVLDAGCGSGYGAAMLAKALPGHEIVGVDIADRAVRHAEAKHGGPANLSYRAADLTSWNDLQSWQPLGKFQYIVCFDVVEHMLHRDVLLMNLAENLAADGLLLFSTPSGRKETLLNPGWEKHKIEYSHRHLYNLMQRFFGEVMIPDDETLPDLDFWRDVINRDEERYLLRGTPMVCAKPIALGFDYFTKLRGG